MGEVSVHYPRLDDVTLVVTAVLVAVVEEQVSVVFPDRRINVVKLVVSTAVAVVETQFSVASQGRRIKVAELLLEVAVLPIATGEGLVKNAVKPSLYVKPNLVLDQEENSAIAGFGSMPKVEPWKRYLHGVNRNSPNAVL